MIYLASPYTHPEANMRELRFRQVCEVAGKLMQNGHIVFSPIAHSHPIEVYGMPDIKDGDFWLKQDFAILEHCNSMYVLKLFGWELSKGIQREIEYATGLGIPVKFIDYDEALAP